MVAAFAGKGWGRAAVGGGGMTAFADLPKRWCVLLEMRDEALANTSVAWPKRAMKPSAAAAKAGHYILGDHLIALEQEHFDRPLATLCHAALIVLIRREIALDAAVPRYFALWDRFQPLLTQHLSLRWLVSAADTFADHGRTPTERALGLAAALFANTIKLYETERVFGLSVDLAAQDLDRLVPKFSLDGITPFKVARGDTIGNMFKRKDRVVQDLGVAGRLLDEVIRRANTVDTVYARFGKLHKSKAHAW